MAQATLCYMGMQLPPQGAQLPSFWPMSILAKRSPISATAEPLLTSVIRFLNVLTSNQHVKLCRNSSRTYINNYSNTTKNNILFIDVSASRRKPSSGLTSGAGRQYVKACPIRGSTGSSPRLDSCCRSS